MANSLFDVAVASPRYRLDLAIVDETCPIGIEVDGERFHRDLDGDRFEADLVRDEHLRRRGWRLPPVRVKPRERENPRGARRRS